MTASAFRTYVPTHGPHVGFSHHRQGAPRWQATAELGSRAFSGQPDPHGTQMAPGRTHGHCPSAAPTWGPVQAQRERSAVKPRVHM